MEYPYTITLDNADFLRVVEDGLRKAVGEVTQKRSLIDASDTVTRITTDNVDRENRFVIELEPTRKTVMKRDKKFREKPDRLLLGDDA